MYWLKLTPLFNQLEAFEIMECSTTQFRPPSILISTVAWDPNLPEKKEEKYKTNEPELVDRLIEGRINLSNDLLHFPKPNSKLQRASFVITNFPWLGTTHLETPPTKTPASTLVPTEYTPSKDKPVSFQSKGNWVEGNVAPSKSS